jgi:hypothetical protein
LRRQSFQSRCEDAAILDDAAKEAHAWLETKYEAFSRPFYEGTGWALPMTSELIQGLQTQFSNPDSYPIESRGVIYAMAFLQPQAFRRSGWRIVLLDDDQG